MKASGKLVAGFLALPLLLAFGYLCAQRKPDKPSFYKGETMDLEGDLWGLPVVEPIYLVATADRPRAGATRWGVSFKDVKASQQLENDFRPDSLTYQRDFILFYDHPASQYGYYSLKQNKTSFLSSHEQFIAFTQASQLRHELYEVEAAYRCWTQTGQLPWAPALFAEHYGGTPPTKPR